MLTLQLRELERDGLLARTVHAEVPPRVEYTLTEPARRLLPILESMGHWLLANHGRFAGSTRKGRRGFPRRPFETVGCYLT